MVSKMVDENEHFNYAISEEKTNLRPTLRHNARFMTTHPYSQQQHQLIVSQNNALDSNIQNKFDHMQHGQTQQASQNYRSSVGYQNEILRNQQTVDTMSRNRGSLRNKIKENKTNPDDQVVDSVSVSETERVAAVHDDETKLTNQIKLPANMENLPKVQEFPTKRSRWNTNEEILALLLNFSKHEEWQLKDVVIRPESGSMLMYSRKKVRYRRDGYCWKKRKDGKTTREDHMKLKVQGVECIYGCYVHSAVLPTFHRRCYWLLQNPDIVLVHYLNVPYPDDSKLTALIPNVAFWTEKKEWTRDELLSQLKPMYENANGKNGKEADTEELKVNRLNVSSFIETMVSQLLEKQRYVKATAANSLECGCGNRKCLGASKCSRPIRRISSDKKQDKRSTNTSATKLQEKRTIHINERNVLKTTPAIGISNAGGVNAENRIHGANQADSAPYYNSQRAQLDADNEQALQLQVKTPQQLQQLSQTQPRRESRRTQNLKPQTPDSHEIGLQPKLRQQLMQTVGVHSPETLTNYSSRVQRYQRPTFEYGNADNQQHYKSNYTTTCSFSEQYVPNADIKGNKEKDMNLTGNITTSLSYNQNDENEFIADKYQSDTTESSDCNSYSSIIHRQASPNDSFASIDDTEAYANGDILDDLILNVNQFHNYDSGERDNADRSLYELVIQLTQKEKKTNCSNSSMTCEKRQQYASQSVNTEGYATMLEDPLVSDANGNFLNSCSRSYSMDDENIGHSHSTLSGDFTRIEGNHVENYSTEIDISFMNISPEFNATDRNGSNQIKNATQTNVPCLIIDLAPEWSYCEGGTKLLIIGPWYFHSEYAVLFDSYSVPATLIQSGVLKCYCPEHTVGLVSVQVVSGGSIISNAVIFEYKKRPNFEENLCHNMCNTKSEHSDQFMYENDTLLKFILIQRIESIQDDAYTHSSSSFNKYEPIKEETAI